MIFRNVPRRLEAYQRILTLEMKKRAEGLQLERILDEEGSEQLAKILDKEGFEKLGFGHDLIFHSIRHREENL